MMTGGNEFTLAVLLLVIGVVLTITEPRFATLGNISNILLDVSQTVIVGIGMTMVILTAGIDVSVGSALAVCAVVVAQAVNAGATLPVAVLVGLAVGTIIGLVNGFLVAIGRIHPIIVTLGMLNILRLVSFKLQGGEWITGLPSTLSYLGNGEILGLPVSWWIALILVTLATIFLRWRPSGRHIYAIGGNAESARLAGINIRMMIISVYALTGLLVGLAAAIYVGGQGQVQTNVGTGFELEVIAAVVIGGTSILGGKGSVVGTLLGALLVATISNALIVVNAPPLLEGLVLGVLIILALVLDRIRRRRRVA
ncbi:MAG: ABC transporter permease [Rubrobacteraceae bacterium]|nr:ABC transporter permease [Rubrobacteraceae bacterium]